MVKWATLLLLLYEVHWAVVLVLGVGLWHRGKVAECVPWLHRQWGLAARVLLLMFLVFDLLCGLVLGLGLGTRPPSRGKSVDGRVNACREGVPSRLTPCPLLPRRRPCARVLHAAENAEPIRNFVCEGIP